MTELPSSRHFEKSGFFAFTLMSSSELRTAYSTSRPHHVSRGRADFSPEVNRIPSALIAQNSRHEAHR